MYSTIKTSKEEKTSQTGGQSNEIDISFPIKIKSRRTVQWHSLF